ncbi:hypothetical protein LguiA_032444 [Lonicera macranthoides]
MEEGSIYSCQNTWRARKKIATRTLGNYRETFPPLDHPDFWICVRNRTLLDCVKILGLPFHSNWYEEFVSA